MTAPLELKSESNPMTRALLFGVFGLFWNAIVLCIGVPMLSDDSLWSLLCLSPFILAGFFLLFGLFPYHLLATRNPKPKLVLASHPIPVGGRTDLVYELEGSPKGVEKITVTLVGREWVQYRRGTDTVTETHSFYEAVVVEATGAEVAGGIGEITIPSDAMHSFKATSNRIDWVLLVRGEIANWPDISEEFPILVGVEG